MSALGSRRTTIVVCFAIVYLVWGSTYVTTKVGVASLPPFLFGAVRFITGGVLLLIVAMLLNRSRGLPLALPTAIEWRHVAIVGFCAVTIANGASIWGLQYVPSNQAALLNVSSSFWIPILGLFGVRAQAISLRTACGLAIGFTGTMLVAWPDSASASVSASPYAHWPTLAILIGCIGWSAGTIYLRNVDSALDLMTFTALQMLCGGCLLLVPAALAGDFANWTWHPTGLMALAYMTIFSSCIAYTAYAWLSINVTPAQVGTYGFVNPVIAMLLGWWILGEVLGSLQIAGMLIILGGMLLMNWPFSPRSASTTARSADA